MQNRTLLNITAGTDHNRLIISAQNRARPNAYPFAKRYLTDDGCAIGNICGFMNHGGVIANPVNRHRGNSLLAGFRR
jgi:hypothetical protein